MERYWAINFKEVFDIEGIENMDTSFWLLYKPSNYQMKNILKKRVRSVRFVNSKEPFLRTHDVVTESVAYLVYKSGEGFMMQSLAEQAESGIIDLGQILLKEGFEGKLLEKWAGYEGPPGGVPCVSYNMISVIYVHETNGFCVLSPKELVSSGMKIRVHTREGWSNSFGDEIKTEWQRDVLVYYNSNKKLLNKAYLEEIFCRVLDTKTFDYEQYFRDTLLDEQMCLDEEKSMELYAFLENSILEDNIKKYYIYGYENTGTEIKDVLFIRRKKELEPELFFDSKPMKVRGYGPERLFEWWIKGSLEKTRLKSAMIGLLE